MTVFDGLPDIFTGTFGQTVSIRNEIGAATDIVGIIRDEDEERAMFDTGLVRGQKVLHVRTADVGHIVDGAEVVIGTTIYKAGAPRGDRNGMTEVPLRSI